MTGVFHIVVAMKPTEGTYAENAIKHGVSGLNIDECRIEGGWTRKATPGTTPYGSEKTWHLRVEGEKSTTHDMDRGADGRFPANVLHDGSDDVVKGFPAQAGSFVMGMKRICKKVHKATSCGIDGNTDEKVGYGDSGSASRFFKECKEYQQ